MLRTEGVTQTIASPSSECGFAVDDDTEIGSKTPLLYQINNVKTAVACRKLCRDDSRCGAWSWGEARGLPARSDVCFLKEMRAQHQPLLRYRKLNMVSGLDCGALWANSPILLPYKAVANANQSLETPLLLGPTCGFGKEDVQFSSEAPIDKLDHVMSETTCRVHCEAVPDCAAWSWGKLRGIADLSDICFLIKRGQRLSARSRRGVISGRVCRTSGSGSAGAVTSDCGRAEVGVSYLTKKVLYRLKNFSSAEMCRMQCSTFPDCGVWTWHGSSNPAWLHGLCVLRALSGGERPVANKMTGSVSGFACQMSASSLTAWLGGLEGAGYKQHTAVLRKRAADALASRPTVSSSLEGMGASQTITSTGVEPPMMAGS